MSHSTKSGMINPWNCQPRCCCSWNISAKYGRCKPAVASNHRGTLQAQQHVLLVRIGLEGSQVEVPTTIMRSSTMVSKLNGPKKCFHRCFMSFMSLLQKEREKQKTRCESGSSPKCDTHTHIHTHTYTHTHIYIYIYVCVCAYTFYNKVYMKGKCWRIPWHFPTPRPGWHSNSWQGRLRPPAEVGWPCHTPACRCAPARRSRRNSGNPPDFGGFGGFGETQQTCFLPKGWKKHGKNTQHDGSWSLLDYFFGKI